MNPDTNFSIRTFIGGYDKNFTYLITCSATGFQILVDASIELEKFSKFIINSPLAILITHSHNDHISFLDNYIKAYPKMKILGYPNSNLLSKIKNFIPLKNNQTLNIGKLNFKVIFTPGHYYDSICYELNPALFTGDTMFVGRTGRVISKKSNIKHLYDSIYNKILKMPDNTRIYPGHDYGDIPSILLQKNIQSSHLLQAKNFDDFKNRMEDYEKNREIGS